MSNPLPPQTKTQKTNLFHHCISTNGTAAMYYSATSLSVSTGLGYCLQHPTISIRIQHTEVHKNQSIKKSYVHTCSFLLWLYTHVLLSFAHQGSHQQPSETSLQIGPAQHIPRKHKHAIEEYMVIIPICPSKAPCSWSMPLIHVFFCHPSFKDWQ